VQTLNVTGPLDNAGEREPWIEFINAGPLPVLFDGWYLTDTIGDLKKWPFPTGFTLGGSSLRTVWADGEANETGGHQVHTSFQLLNSRPLALVRDQPGGPAVLDYLVTPALLPDTSYGSLPDAQAFLRDLFDRPTPGSLNASLPVPEIVTVEQTDDGRIRFAWGTVPGVRYRVEAAAAVPSQTWQTLAEEVAASEGMTYTGRPVSGPQFYRVVVP
jgi:hypothetical protein